MQICRFRIFENRLPLLHNLFNHSILRYYWCAVSVVHTVPVLIPVLLVCGIWYTQSHSLYPYYWCVVCGTHSPIPNTRINVLLLCDMWYTQSHSLYLYYWCVVPVVYTVPFLIPVLLVCGMCATQSHSLYPY